MLNLQSITRGWDRFFFEEKPTEGIALFRILWMSLIFFYFLLDIANIEDFYGPHAIISQATTRQQFPSFQINVFNLFHSSYETTYAIFIVYGVALFTSLIGFCTRTSLAVAFILMTSLHQRNVWLLSSAELLMRTITLFLVFSPAGHSLSVDALLGRFFPQFKKKRSWPVWSLRLIQIQISIIYLWTFWHKLKGETWVDGTAVYYATRIESMTNFSIPFVMDSLTLLKWAAWGTLLVEFSLGVLIWIEEFRKPLIFIGILFHLSIEYFMSIPFFELYMIVLLINFFKPEELKAFLRTAVDVVAAGVHQSSVPSDAKEKIIRTLRG